MSCKSEFSLQAWWKCPWKIWIFTTGVVKMSCKSEFSLQAWWKCRENLNFHYRCGENVVKIWIFTNGCGENVMKIWIFTTSMVKMSWKSEFSLQAWWKCRENLEWCKCCVFTMAWCKFEFLPQRWCKCYVFTTAWCKYCVYKSEFSPQCGVNLNFDHM